MCGLGIKLRKNMRKEIFVTGLLISCILLGMIILGLSRADFFSALPLPGVGGSRELPQNCMREPDGYKRWTCLGPYFENLTMQTSAKTAVSEASKLKQQRLVSDCHILTHFIGEANLEKHDFDIGGAIASCAVGECRYGCVHGAVERYSRNEPDPYEFISKISDMCESLEGDFAQKMNCAHGVGHGLFTHNYLSPQEAIYACEALGEQWTPFCIDGVAMQNVDQYLHLDEEGLREVIPRICAPFKLEGRQISVPHRLMNYCVTRMASGLLFYTGYDIERSEALCEELPQDVDRSVCKDGMYEHIARKKPSNIDMEEFLQSPFSDIRILPAFLPAPQ